MSFLIFLHHTSKLLNGNWSKLVISRTILTSNVVRQNNSSRPTLEKVTTANNDSEEESFTIKDRILQASLPYVPSLGWSKDSLAAGANDCGYSGVANGLFVNGGADLVHYFNSSSNEKLEKEIQLFISNADRLNDKIIVKMAMTTRIQAIIPYINKWPQALALMLTPKNSLEATKNLTNLIDTVCFHAGYKELNTIWYARRLSLAALYKSTELYLLQDKSPGHDSTWKYLDQSLQRMDLAQESINQFKDADKVVTGSIITVRNMLGLNHM